MKNTSIWKENINYKPNQKLNKNINVDVLIIGGGITGLSTCYQLKDSNLKICLVEKNTIGHGVTARTTGKLTYLQETIYQKLEKIYDINIAKQYLKSQIDAIKAVENIVKNNNINCDYTKVRSYIYTNKENDIKSIQKEKEILNKMNIKVKEHTNLKDKTEIKYGISVENTAVFHPVKYLIKLKDICEKNSNIQIYENTKVIDIKKDKDFICKTDTNIIYAKKVVLALHYPYFIFPYMFPLKTHLEKSYIAAYEANKNDHFTAITSKKPTTSIRYLDVNDKIYKFCLKNSHNLAFKNDATKNFDKLLKNINQTPDYIWSNKDIITSDHLPLIGQIKNNMYIATGYNTWGMTNGTIAGIILKDLILDNYNEYIGLFNPNRPLKNKLINIPINMYSSIKAYIDSKIYKNKTHKNLKFTKDLAIYIDDKGNKHTVYNKCPHLKCNLIFNEKEKTWDCPCHGSRFNIDGKSIEGPSNYDISIKH